MAVPSRDDTPIAKYPVAHHYSYNSKKHQFRLNYSEEHEVRWAAEISKTFGMNVAEETPAILRAWEGLEAYIEDMIAVRRRSLTDDLISELIRAENAGDRLTHDELVNLVAILLNAGTDTTRNQLGAAVQALADHPDQWALLASRPELAPNAVEELMRGEERRAAAHQDRVGG
jgi:cytochrome P450